MFFHRGIRRILSRNVAPCAPLAELMCRRQIIRKSSTFRQHASITIGSRSSGYVISHRELCSREELNINSIKNVFCKEISIDDIGEFVQVRGFAASIKKWDFVVLKDKTGSVRLDFDKNRKDLMEWLEKIEKYSYLKIIGIVKAADKNAEADKNEVNVAVHYVISSIPPSATGNIKITNLEQENETTQSLEQSTTSVNTITCEKISKEDIGKTVQVFGWINSIDKDKKFFILSGTQKFIKIVPDIVEDVSHEVKKLSVGDVVVVQGPVGQDAVQLMKHRDFNRDDVTIQISAYFVRKLNEENCLGLRAPDVNCYTLRTHNCGQLNASYVGQNVRLMGWVVFIRMNKFILLQDRYGLVQLRMTAQGKKLGDIVKDLSLESVLCVEGIVSLRPPGNENTAMKTGEIEVEVRNLTVINKAEALPFYQKDARPNKGFQMEYKYLDLRHQSVSRMHLEFRCQILHKMRKFFIERVGFTEVETPTLFSRTPGGAQEFIVPTRKKGEFYALVQSPQQFKQLLMVGGMDRYFQIARCYRDEVGKKDRQPEFTQLDIEMSFCNREGVIKLIEDLVKFIWPKSFVPITFPFPRMTYEEAMTAYGTDKPDTRFEWKITDVTNAFKRAGKSCSEKINMEKYMTMEDFTALALVAKEGMIAYPSVRQFAEELALADGCKVFSFKLETKNKLDNYLNKLFVQPLLEDIKTSLSYDSKDIVFLGFGQRTKLLKSFGSLRKTTAKIVEECGIHVIDRNQPFNFLWVVDFPLFEEVDGVTQSIHHPFTQPHPLDVRLLETDPLKARGLHYDLVLNGNEIGGGSIRIHQPELQEKVLCDILKLDKIYFKHLLDALSYGAPVHGGFALGIDRFISLLRGVQSITDVIAFPKFSTGRDPISKAPSDIPQADKYLYHIL